MANRCDLREQAGKEELVVPPFYRGSIELHFGVSRPVGHSAGNMVEYSVCILSPGERGLFPELVPVFGRGTTSL